MAAYPARGEGYGNQRPSVVTGDAIPLELSPAGLATRILAFLLDAFVQVILLFVLGLVLALIGLGLDNAATMAVQISVSVLILVGYPTAFESLTAGRSLGKLALGLRVVGTDGSPERFRQALARALCGFVEIWGFWAIPALVTSLLSAEGRRIGDFLAGTMVVQERAATAQRELVGMPPRLEAWAQGAELSQLSSDTLAAARQYVLRYTELAPHARHEMGVRVATEVARGVTPPPPPDTSPVEFLAAVLAERRRREEARMARQRPQDGGGAPGPAWQGHPGHEVPRGGHPGWPGQGTY